ncbi:MAG: Histidinol dehydrogenase [uncultured Solirubrobacteraceae bacterium]|uniref:Histidinol dehydrogenase n=1 Tax=uncultured Solirubrobacteraceae bacterium TaxID=1162706 RepID=A0A6J4SH20_9ACTN|nr:MAG: Histidinol dehydrogenase [uncultured Solirubrobacteraceae bacterium]
MAPDAGAVRALVAGAGSVAGEVARIVEDVRTGGDAALAAYVERFDRTGGAAVRVPGEELAAALDALDPAVRAGLEVAIANVEAVARAGVAGPKQVPLPQGHVVVLREEPVRRAAVYAPGGRNPYPSTVVMGAITARAAEVEEIAVCAPGSHPVILAACALCEVGEVYRMGGAHAIAALAHGTPSIPRVDVIAGPGGLYVQEAKRQVSGVCGIDGFFGPSDVCVLAGAGADPGLVAADLRAQAEHGPGTLVVCVAQDPGLLGAVEAELAAAADTEAVGVTVQVEGPEAALAFAEAFAPEHLELVGAGMEELAPRVRSAGCLFVGREGATAFGDYVAGSNHSLPTGGAARYASTLNVRHFRRRMSEVRIGPAAAALAAAGAPIARAEGFAEHAASMEMRQDGGR